MFMEWSLGYEEVKRIRSLGCHHISYLEELNYIIFIVEGLQVLVDEGEDHVWFILQDFVDFLTDEL